MIFHFKSQMLIFRLNFPKDFAPTYHNWFYRIAKRKMELIKKYLRREFNMSDLNFESSFKGL